EFNAADLCLTAATEKSLMPQCPTFCSCLGKESRWPQVQVAVWLARGGRSRVDSGRQQQRVRSFATLVWVSTSGGRGRWATVHDRSLKEEQQIWFRIACLDAQAAVEAGLSWARLPPGRIRRCCCRRGELGVAAAAEEN
ncbi:hypothetical protein BHM03_00059521, partial [Ensete ventricosum]